MKKNSKTKTKHKNHSAGVLKRLLLSNKIAFIAVGLLIGGIGSYLSFSSNAATTVAVGSQFHCTWSYYTDAQRTAVLDKLAAAKITSVRIDVGWGSFQETSRDTYSQWYVNRTDFCVNQARARGLEVMLVVHRTPGWANGNQAANVPPTDLNDYANFAGWLADHYKGKVIGYEVWNEADPAQSFWSGTSDQYVSMLRLAYPKIKAADPSTKVVLAGPSNNNLPWLTDIYAKGAKPYFDVLATHPYNAIANQPPEAPASDGKWWWFSAVPQVQNLMNQYGDGSKEIWFTEFGWSSHDNATGTPNWQLGVTAAQQGDYFVRAVKYAQANYPRVTRMFWYNERNVSGTDIQNGNYGLLNNDLSEKPAYTAIKNYLTSGTPAPAPDTQPPSTQITNPTSGATVSGTVTITGTASDASGINHVDLLVDGAIKTAIPLAPYTYGLITTQLANGAHSLQYKAYDGAGNVGASSVISITVNNTSTPPPAPVPVAQPDLILTAISWSPANPKPGQPVTFSATLKNQGTAATPAGTVHAIDFKVDGIRSTWSNSYVSSLAPGASVTLAANTGNNGSSTWSALVGSHSIEAITDPSGAISESNEVNNQLSKVIGSKDSSKPTRPGKPSSSLITQSQIALTWPAASDDTAVTGYDVYRNELKVGTTTGTNFTDESLMPATTYGYKLIAYDAAGNYGEGSEVLSVSTGTANTTQTIAAAKLATPPNTDRAFAIVPAGSTATVAIPSNSQPTVSGLIKLTVPGNQSAKTALSIDGNKVKTVSGNLIAIDTTTLSNGVHTITLTSTDELGVEQTTSRYISVANNLNPIEKVRNVLFRPVAGKWSGRSMNVAMSTNSLLIVAGLFGLNRFARRRFVPHFKKLS